MNYKRRAFKELKKRLKEKRRFIQTVIGPRQVGKTTLVNQLLSSLSFPNHFVSADAIGAYNSAWLHQQWATARVKLKASNSKVLILAVDEIQKINDWSEIVKAEWDEDTKKKVNIKVILLGSSRLLIEKGLTESLAGRFETIHLGHWSFEEMNDAFGINAEQYVWFGGYPGSIDLISDENRWKDYVKNSLIETTISKDILMLTRIDKPALLKRFFELGCLFSGQIVSYTKMLGQLQDAGNTTTLSHYLNLLDTAGLIGGLEKIYTEDFCKRASTPKLQVHNTALISAQLPETFNEIKQQPLKWGGMIETAIGAHLINYSKTEKLKVFYWKHRNDEIDFAIQYKNKLIGLEIKNGCGTSTHGMSEFQKEFNPDKVLLIGNTGLEWQTFLKLNPTELF
ncbi:MAG: AAA family ATPase [Chlamydiae bacterium]|nr:MAG: AAA family ATPase [Chlamydiota bacterium]